MNDPSTDQVPPQTPGKGRWWKRKNDQLSSATIDLMVSFAMLDESLDRRETGMMLDILYGAFPEIDHSTLKRRVKRSMRSPQPLLKLAKTLKKQLDHPMRSAVALQTFVLANAGHGAENRKKNAFIQLCETLEIPHVAGALLRELAGEIVPDFPFERVTFGHTEDCHVALPPDAVGNSFTLYKSTADLWVRNTGDHPLWARGHTLEKNEFLRLIDQQDIAVPGWRLGQEDFNFFLNAARSGKTTTVYVGAEDGKVSVARSKSRLNRIKVELGCSATLSGSRIPRLSPSDDPEKCSYHTSLAFRGAPPLSLESLRRDAIHSGERLQLTQASPNCLVSNDQSALSESDLLITPGLSPHSVLRITSNPATATGQLEILKSDGNISIDGQTVRATAELPNNCLIRLSKAQAIRCRFSENILDEERTLIRDLQLVDLSHTFRSGTIAFGNLHLSLKRGEMMAIIGPSGCGKSSLLSTISGHLEPKNGRVLINGQNLYESREQLLPFIAHMPQEESLSVNLSVREHLRHSFMVRRPHLHSGERRRRVDSVLNELGLERLSTRKVGEPGDKSLSGGERGRLNLGLDLGSSAEIFLFDEPTSGLSSKDSEHLAQNLRSLARDRLVICSLHRPGTRVLGLFDKVLLLDKGGKLAYYGTPEAMTKYFRTAAKELDVPIRATNSGGYGADFVFDVLESPLLTPGVAARGMTRRFPPEFWEERFESAELIEEIATGPSDKPSRLDSSHSLPSPRSLTWRERRTLFRVHLERAFYSKFRSSGTIWSILLETPLLAALIGLTLRASPDSAYDFATGLHIPIFLFLTVTVGMFLGLTNSATEILRDRSQLVRERNCRRSTVSYVLAKFGILSLLGAIQCALFLWIGHILLDIDGMFWRHWSFMALTTASGTAIALLISASVRTERAALNAVPLLLVPQILLAGALVPFDEMNRGLFQGGDRGRAAGYEPIPARVIPLRYAFEGLLVAQATGNEYEIYRNQLQDTVDSLKDKPELTTEEQAQFTTVKAALLRITVAEADTMPTARAILGEIQACTDTADLERLEKLELYRGEEKRQKPLSGFFVNDRVDKLLSKAEAYRQDYREVKSSSVFLAKKRDIFGITLPTTFASALVLTALTTILLFLAAVVTRLRYQGDRISKAKKWVWGE